MTPMQLRRPSGQQVLEVMRSVGCGEYLFDYVVGKTDVTGKAGLWMINRLLRQDARFIESNLHHLHVDVGKRRTDFRSRKGSICPGSLQIVICLDSGRFYADIDKWNPAQDLINWLGHTVFEVIGPRVVRKEEDHAIAA